MNWLLLCRMLGLLGMLVGGSMVFSLPWAFPLFGETNEIETGGFWGLVGAIGCSLVVGGSLFLIGRKETGSILRKEALAVVGLGWIFAGILGALPYLFSGTMRAPDVPMTIADAVFESVSGFTTTGASVLTQLQDPAFANETDPARHAEKLVPRCILFWRSFTHWLGGMGIIVLFVAILGQLGAGGKALMRREVPGPITETVRPRVRETALAMWGIYVGISVLLTVALMLEQMTFYDAVCHSFGTMATGGFSTYNASVGYFSSAAAGGRYNGLLIELTIVVFMIAAGTNFSLYYLALTKRDHQGRANVRARLATVFSDPEFRTYLGILFVATCLLAGSIWWENHYTDIWESLRHSLFMSVTIMTTTGFGTEDFHHWNEFSKGLLLLLMFVGGCAGSTGGGMKVVRFMLFSKIIRLEIEHAFRPNVVRPLRIAGVKLDDSFRHDVMVYFCLVLLIFISSWMVLAAIEPNTQWMDRVGHSESEKLLDCASAVAATLNNIGPGIGVLGPHNNYSDFSTQGKFLLTLLMLLGRLELFAILVLFAPSFWRSQ